jgi:hypothetical protein
MPVVEVLHEDGSAEIVLLIQPSGSLPVHPYGACAGECGLCGEQPSGPMTGAEFVDAIHEAVPEAFSDLDGPLE